MESYIIDKVYFNITSYWSWWWEVDNEIDKISRTFLTILVPILVILWYKWLGSYPKTPLPPGPYGLPILGYLPFLSSNLHERFTEMAHKYGPIFSLRLGSKLNVVVNSMDLAKVVAREMDHTFANRDPPVVALTATYGAQDIAWSNNNAHWRSMRKLLATQLMSNASLAACQGFRTDAVRKLVRNVYSRVGSKVDVNEVAFDTSLDVITSTLWGSSEGINDILDGFREVAFKIIELEGLPNISDFFPLLSLFDLQGRNREMKKQLLHLERILDSVINSRIHANSRKKEGQVDQEDGRKDFVQIMLELKDQTPTSFNVVKMKALLFDIVLASTETTSTMVEWVMAEILHNPSIKEMVHEEMREVIGMNNIVEESHLSKLTYLDAVIKETLRLHPPLPFLIHRCPDESRTVGGYIIPKGSTVYINVWAIHRDPKNWANPLEFKPERFVGGKWDYLGNNFKFLPFGSGRRICAGIPLGEKLLMYILASLLHFFDWSLPKDVKFELSDEFGFVTKKRKPLIVIPSQRFADETLYL